MDDEGDRGGRAGGHGSVRSQRAGVLTGLATLAVATALLVGAQFLPLPARLPLSVLALLGCWRAHVRAVRAQVRLARDCTVDPLTGLYNRRHLEHRLADEAARSLRYGGGFALCVVDLDNFKAFNDRYGHVEGDRRLRQTARVLRQAVRETDLAFRYGGEEFVLLLPHCEALAAADVAERALEALRGTGVTASVGVADFPGAGAQAGAVLAEADAACLRAKAAGKDRVVCRPALRRALAALR